MLTPAEQYVQILDLSPDGAALWDWVVDLAERLGQIESQLQQITEDPYLAELVAGGLVAVRPAMTEHFDITLPVGAAVDSFDARRLLARLLEQEAS